MGTDLEIQDDLEIQQDEPKKGPESVADVPVEGQPKVPGWDKERQQQDFEKANSRYKRAEAELSTMTEAYEQANARLAALEQQLQTLQTAKQIEQDKLDDMDPDLVDEKVAGNIKALERRLKEKEQQLSQVVKKIDLYEQQQAQVEARRRNEEARESVLSTVEDILIQAGVTGSARFRGEAIKLADDMVDGGEVRQPGTIAEAVKLMTKCYLQVKNDKEKGKTKTVSVDTGKGGATQPGSKKSGIKEGAMPDVAKQMLADRSWLED